MRGDWDRINIFLVVPSYRHHRLASIHSKHSNFRIWALSDHRCQLVLVDLRQRTADVLLFMWNKQSPPTCRKLITPGPWVLSKFILVPACIYCYVSGLHKNIGKNSKWQPKGKFERLFEHCDLCVMVWEISSCLNKKSKT